MKKRLSKLLMVLLVCLSAVSCRPVNGEKTLDLSSLPVSSADNPIENSIPAQVSSPNQEKIFSEPVTPSSQQEERWISPTGVLIYTSQALYNYYEAHPLFKEYYYTYLVPLGVMAGKTWKDESDFPSYLFLFCSI